METLEMFTFKAEEDTVKSWLAEANYKTVMHILIEHAPQGMVTAPSLSEIKEHLDNTRVGMRCDFWWCPVQESRNWTRWFL